MELFEKFQLKDLSCRNRIAVSPMCQYSSVDGFPTEWHLVHLGSRAVGGAGLVIVEATAVAPEGRISPADSGIYTDQHIEPFARIVKFMKEQGAAAGIQIAHAGRKGSAQPPWEGGAHLSIDQGGWETLAPSALPYGEHLSKVPTAMSLAEIARVQADFVSAAKRALAAGFECLQVHFAHGYLAHEFFSPLSNQRNDQYGGSFDNRIRFLLETFEAVRQVWPERLPLTVRLSVTDWIDGGVTVEEALELTRRLKSLGLDMLDVSHGMLVPGPAPVPSDPGFMIPYAGRFRRDVEIATTTSWLITEPEQAATAVRTDQLDMVTLAREMLRDPYWPYHAALQLGDPAAGNLLPVQYARAVAS